MSFARAPDRPHRGADRRLEEGTQEGEGMGTGIEGSGKGAKGLRRFLGLAIGLGAALLAVPAAAHAVTVQRVTLGPSGGPEFHVAAGSGEVNRITIHESPPFGPYAGVYPGILFHEGNAAVSIGHLTASPSCQMYDSRTVHCYAWIGPPIASLVIRVNLADGNDTYQGPASADVPLAGRAIVVHGGSGNDVLAGGAWRHDLVGGSGNDVLTVGSAGGNQLVGGSGWDLLRANANGAPDATIGCDGQGRAARDAHDPAARSCTVSASGIGAQLTQTPGAYGDTRRPTFAWKSVGGEPRTHNQCRIDGGGWSSCGSWNGKPMPSALTQGQHTFEVRLRDIAGEWGEPASHRWTVDTIVPAVAIASRPDPVTAQTEASFEWTIDDATETTSQCRRFAQGTTPPVWQACQGQRTYSELGSGTHVFQVRATDAAGNATTETYEWLVDLTPPDVERDGFGAQVITNDPRPPLPSFDSPSANATHFECRVDGEGPWRECASGERWPGPDLPDGVRRIAVRAVSHAGLATPPPLPAQKYLIDTVSPAVSFDAGQDPAGAEVVRASYVEGGSGFAGARIAARPRNSHAQWRALPTSEQNGRIWASLDSLAPGLYEFRARVSDRAGNHGVTTRTTQGTDLVIDVSLIGTALSAGWPDRHPPRLIVRHGRRAQVVARLATAAGTPLAGRLLLVHELFRAGSTEAERVRTARTDARGELAVGIPPGPSRAVRIEHAAAGRFAASQARELELVVRSRARLRVRKRVRPGGVARFRGRVACRGALKRRKTVVLQVRVGRKWRTVENPKRTRPNGRFRLRYRFGRFYTRPTAFRFRLRVPNERGWPCAFVRSNVRKVRVIPAGARR